MHKILYKFVKSKKEVRYFQYSEMDSKDYVNELEI